MCMPTGIIVLITDTTLSYRLRRTNDILSIQYPLCDLTCTVASTNKLTTAVLVNRSVWVCTDAPSIGVPVCQGYLDVQISCQLFIIRIFTLSHVRI